MTQPGQPVPIVLNYASPPPERLKRTHPLILLVRWFAAASIGYYLLLLFWEPAFQSGLHRHDERAWFSNELKRRINERDRRAGRSVPPPPPIPAPVAPGPLLVAALTAARLVALIWGIWLAMGLRRCGSEIELARGLIHVACVSKLAIVGPVLVLAVVAYAKPFLQAGVRSPLLVLAVEAISIAAAWALLLNNPLPSRPRD
ncbi:MAG TPA: hypothetical protein VNL70_01150 [Tepidisphaeraceae bacterium]|nr:hypothetical protein [Tepidisphaeraceae bacterium]